MNKYLVIIILLLFHLTLSAQENKPINIIDSLHARKELKEIVNNVNDIRIQITTLDDADKFSPSLVQQKERIAHLSSTYPWIFSDELYKQYLECLKAIDDNITKLNKEETLLSQRRNLHEWSAKFDTLLLNGQKYSQRKEIDSVRLVKSIAQSWWGAINNTSRSVFEADDSLKQDYQHVEQTFAKINSLSEKERTSPLTILLVIVAVLGVASMIWSTLNPFIAQRKNKKQQQEEKDYVEI